MDGIGSRLTTLLGHVPELSLRALDDLAGKTKSGLAQKMIDRADYRPTFDTVESYARALGADVRWLGSGEGAAPAASRVRRVVRDALAALDRGAKHGAQRTRPDAAGKLRRRTAARA